jgi:hypothetical protein
MYKFLKALAAASGCFLTALFIIPQIVIAAFGAVGMGPEPVAVSFMMMLATCIGGFCSLAVFFNFMSDGKE